MKLKNPKVLKRFAIAFAIVISAALIYTHFLADHTLEARQRTQLESTYNQLIETRESLQNSKQSEEEKQKQLEELNKQLEAKEKELQAKREANSAVAKSVPTSKVLAPSQITGSKQDWLKASGIPESEWGYVDLLVTRESGWNPNAVNKSSGACGLGQQLPCGKWPGAWNDPVAALKAMNTYVQKYGGWAGANAFWERTDPRPYPGHWY